MVEEPVRVVGGARTDSIGEDAVIALDPDLLLRQAALSRARELAMVFDDLVPIAALREGFRFAGENVSFGSFMKGIHRARVQQGQAALTLMTVAPKPGQGAPYEDSIDPATRTIVYHYRAGSPDQPDNRALRAAFEIQVPLIYFLGVAPGQYQVIAPVFIREDDPNTGVVLLELGLPVQDTQGAGLVSTPGARAEQFAMVVRRLDQVQFRRNVLRAYRERCAVCALREPQLIEAAHITRFSEASAISTVVNGLALCAIHHLAYDRNLMGIDPGGVVHIGARLLHEIDGPMLKTGLQGFHGASISQPKQPADRPEPERLAARFEAFQAA